MTTTLLQQALDALVYHTDQTRPIHSTQMTIDAIRAHLAAAQPAPAEPVAYQIALPDGQWMNCSLPLYEAGKNRGKTVRALYEHPPAQPAPVPLTDTRKLCTCDGAGRGPGRACVVKAGGRLGELWRCAHGIAASPEVP